MLYLLIVVFLLVNLMFAAQFEDSSYTKISLCDMSSKLSEGCMYPVTHLGVRSLVECSTLCGRDSGCEGATWNTETQTCFLHTSCESSCCVEVAPSEFFHLVKNYPSCQNNGMWNATTRRCECVDGWVGELCERDYPYSCEEFYQHGYTDSYFHTWLDINRDKSYHMFVLCAKVDDEYIRTYICYSDGSIQNNGTYYDFVNGYFYEDNFWLGLENMKILSQKGYKTVRLEVIFEYNQEEEKFSNKYIGFNIGNSSSGYEMSYTFVWVMANNGMGLELGIDLDDCFGATSGLQFSTWDHEATGNACAGQHGAGWWFPSDCGGCNPLGVKRSEMPDLPSTAYINIPNLNMGDSSVEDAFRFFEMFYETNQ